MKEINILFVLIILINSSNAQMMPSQILNAETALIDGKSNTKKTQLTNQDSVWIVNNYYKIERSILMRDGVKLFTSIYLPKDSSQKHPIMLMRTPYSCAPYGPKEFRNFWGRNTQWYFKEKYIVILQDVRGRWMSEGVFEDIRPYIENKTSKTDIDEA